MGNNYFDRAIEFENLYKGLKKSCRNVRWKDSVVGYENNGLKNTWKLRNDILTGKYKISPYQVFTIHEPKERVIVATRIPDRQFQRSLCDTGLYKDITEHFIRDNVACQQGKGTDDALNRMKIHLRRYYRKHGKEGWVLRCDIHHFFPETTHEVAKAAVRKRVSDEKAAEAVCRIIDSFGGDKGIGLGSQVSQLVELAVLDDLDHLIKERLRVKHYIRYMDDFILIHESREYLRCCKEAIEEHLAERSLTLNRKTNIHPLRQGIKFLQWHFYLTDTGKVIMRMDRKKISRERKKLVKIREKELAGEIPEGTAYESYQAWMANAKRGNTRREQNAMTAYYKAITGGKADGKGKLPKKKDGRVSG